MSKVISISVPDYLFTQIEDQVEKGKRSDFIIGAVKEKLNDLRLKFKKKDPIEDFFSDVGRLNITTEQIVEAIREGRNER